MAVDQEAESSTDSQGDLVKAGSHLLGSSQDVILPSVLYPVRA